MDIFIIDDFDFNDRKIAISSCLLFLDKINYYRQYDEINDIEYIDNDYFRTLSELYIEEAKYSFALNIIKTLLKSTIVRERLHLIECICSIFSIIVGDEWAIYAWKSSPNEEDYYDDCPFKEDVYNIEKVQLINKTFEIFEILFKTLDENYNEIISHKPEWMINEDEKKPKLVYFFEFITLFIGMIRFTEDIKYINAFSLYLNFVNKYSPNTAYFIVNKWLIHIKLTEVDASNLLSEIKEKFSKSIKPLSFINIKSPLLKEFVPKFISLNDPDFYRNALALYVSGEGREEINEKNQRRQQRRNELKYGKEIRKFSTIDNSRSFRSRYANNERSIKKNRYLDKLLEEEILDVKRMKSSGVSQSFEKLKNREKQEIK